MEYAKPRTLLSIYPWCFRYLHLYCSCRKPSVVTKYVGSDDEPPLDETVNQEGSNENSENEVDMKCLPKGK